MNRFMQRYETLGESFDPELVTIKKSLRVNTLKIDEKKLISRLRKAGVSLEKIPFLKYGYYYEAPFALSSTPEYLLGYFYLQEAASQIPAEVLLSNCKNQEKITILDLAAAPGSKTTHLAQLTNDRATIVAVDDNAPRLDTLRYNLERLGISSVISYRKDGRFVRDLGQMFDFILLDAPCSGNFCVEKNFFTERSILLGVKERARLQKELLKVAYRILKSGGTLVYSTCSLEPEENELIINWFVSFFDDIIIEPIYIDVAQEGYTEVFGESLHKDIKYTRRFWPHKTETEGFFIAKLRKE